MQSQKSDTWTACSMSVRRETQEECTANTSSILHAKSPYMHHPLRACGHHRSSMGLANAHGRGVQKQLLREVPVVVPTPVGNNRMFRVTSPKSKQRYAYLQRAPLLDTGMSHSFGFCTLADIVATDSVNACTWEKGCARTAITATRWVSMMSTIVLFEQN